VSLYGDYLKERLGDEIIETEQGFATYRFPDPLTCYVVDIYVKPEFRTQSVATGIADLIVEIAKQKGCSRLLGSVVPSTKGSTTSLRVLLGYGFSLDSSTQDFILFRKDI